MNDEIMTVESEVVEVVGEVVEDPRLFLETPFSEYTVSEGLLLSLFLAVIFAALAKIIKGGFNWLS